MYLVKGLYPFEGKYEVFRSASAANIYGLNHFGYGNYVVIGGTECDGRQAA